MSIKRLQNEYMQQKKDPNYYFSMDLIDNSLTNWKFILIGPPDTIYEGGTFEGKVTFPPEYPNKPPIVKFTSDILHPNIYKDGKVCISILHEGVDQYNYESTSERWNPSHGINSIMMSILSMLSDANIESPANIDASVLFKDDYKEFKNRVYKLISK
tara:strand:+ start:320 stop:790 length:471 start_codon:yes stop_codon:yes gene_type:complete